MATWIMRVMSGGGYFAIVLLMVLENVFPPIPSEVILPLAGYMARTPELHFAGVVVAATVGSVLGSMPLYYAGRKVGIERIRRSARRHSRWTTISVDDITRAEEWFDRHGTKAVVLCRLVPGIRSLISIPAGIRRMPLGKFVLCTACGSLVWSTILTYAGYLMGQAYRQIEKYLDPVSWVIAGVLVLWYLYRVVRG